MLDNEQKWFDSEQEVLNSIKWQLRQDREQERLHGADETGESCMNTEQKGLFSK